MKFFLEEAGRIINEESRTPFGIRLSLCRCTQGADVFNRELAPGQHPARAVDQLLRETCRDRFL